MAGVDVTYIKPREMANGIANSISNSILPEQQQSHQSMEDSTVTEEIDKSFLEELDHFQTEYKQWNKLLADYRSQAKDSKKMLQQVQENDDPRRALHGPRRSRYVAPPKFKFSCEDVLSEVDQMLEEATVAAKVIAERKLVYGALAEPSQTSSSNIQENMDENTGSLNQTRRTSHLSHVQLQGLPTGESNLTMSNKSTRTIFETLVGNKE